MYHITEKVQIYNKPVFFTSDQIEEITAIVSELPLAITYDTHERQHKLSTITINQ